MVGQDREMAVQREIRRLNIVSERGLLDDRDLSVESEVLHVFGAYRVVRRMGSRVPESKYYGLHKVFGDPVVFRVVGDFSREADAVRAMRRAKQPIPLMDLTDDRQS